MTRLTTAHAQSPPQHYVLAQQWLPPELPDTVLDPAGAAGGPDGLWYVADRGGGRVAVIDGAGRVVRTIGRRGDGNADLLHPAGIALDAARGRVYVGDTGHGRIQVYRLDGTYETSFTAGARSFGYVADAMVVTPAGDLIFINRQRDVQDPAEYAYGPLVERLAPDGTWLDGWYLYDLVTHSGGQVRTPPTHGLAAAPDGSLVLASADGQVVHISVGGDLLSVQDLPAVALIAAPGRVPSRLVDLILTPDGALTLLVDRPPAVVFVPAQGKPRWVQADGLGQHAQFRRPAALAAKPGGGLAVLAARPEGGRAVWQLNGAGRFLAVTGLEPTAAVGAVAAAAISAGPDGLYALDSAAERVAVLGPAGQAMPGIPAPLAGRDLAALADGGVLIAGMLTDEDAGDAHAEPLRYGGLVRFDRTGDLRWQAPPSPAGAIGPGAQDGPACCPGITAVAADDQHGYVAQIDDGVLVIDLATGTVVTARSPDGAAMGYGNGFAPSDVATDGAGHVLTADPLAATLEVWSSSAAYVPGRRWSLGRAGMPWRAAAGGERGDPRVAVVRMDGGIDVYSAQGERVDHWSVPALAGHSRSDPQDVAVGADGTVYVLDGVSGAILVYAPQRPPVTSTSTATSAPTSSAPATARSAPPSATPVPTLDPNPPVIGRCGVRGSGVAEPVEVQVGQTVHVTLTLRVDCPPETGQPADVVLVVDTSASMQGAPLEAARDAVSSFLLQLPAGRHRVGLVTLSDTARLALPLTDQWGQVRAALSAASSGGAANLGAAILTAADHLRTAGRPEAVPVIVLLTDGLPTCCGEWPAPGFASLRAAAMARQDGIALFAVGLGETDPVKLTLLRTLATGDGFYYTARESAALDGIYRAIAGQVQAFVGRHLVLESRLSDAVGYRALSSRPAAERVDQVLTWTQPWLANQPLITRYDVRPLLPGVYSPHITAHASWVDPDGLPPGFDFPRPLITVRAAPARIYLPIIAHGSCLRPDALALALVVDSSAGGSGSKSAVAKGTARAILDWLYQGTDLGGGALQGRVMLVSYDADAQILVPLTHEYQPFVDALDHMEERPGARIDRALGTAAAALAAGRVAGEQATLILISDGRHQGDPADVTAAAEEIRASGVRTFAIGVGDGADDALLTTAAGEAGRYFRVANAQGVESVWPFLFTKVALACPYTP